MASGYFPNGMCDRFECTDNAVWNTSMNAWGKDSVFNRVGERVIPIAVSASSHGCQDFDIKRTARGFSF